MKKSFFSLVSLTGVVIALLGLSYLALGGWLAVLGGTPWYILFGVGFLASGVCLALYRSAGFGLYLLTFIACAIWSLSEVGLDGWQLMPRLFGLAVLGIWISMPWITRPVMAQNTPRVTGLFTGCFYLAAIAGIFYAGWQVTDSRFVQHQPLPEAKAGAAPAQEANADDWHFYGRTAAGQRYSPLEQLTPANVSQLQPAWEYHTGDSMREGEDKAGREFNFEVTPIKVGNVLYICTPHRQVIALDATTGEQRWRFDPHPDTSANEYLACRGVAYSKTTEDKSCPEKIITTTSNARMVALNAQTGKPCASFGEQGFVSLTDRMGEVPPGFHFITSQPLVMDNRIVLGGWIYDNQATGEPSGVVRAYDATSGKLAWSWDMGRSPQNAQLKPGEEFTRGTPNGWGTYTADPESGLVYIPLGNATPDYYGAKRRPFDEKYSSALVALDIHTGLERWHFQTVHHDVWDYDLPIGPTLVDLPDGQGGVLPALIQTTKMGQLFMLDRRTGKPLAQVEEKPVPASPALPGEHLSPTQPDSVGMPNLAPPDLKETDMWGATPIDQLWCRIQFHRFRYQGKFTPPAEGTSIAYPAFDGVMDWYGASVDPLRHVLIANTSYIPFTMQLLKSGEAIKQGLMKSWAGWGSKEAYPKPKEFAVGPQYGTPWAAVVKPWLTALGAPCSAPPWGKLVAIDLTTRKIAWERPAGTTRDMNIFGTHTNAPLPTGIFMIGGNIVTRSGLIFMGATADNYLRAFDEMNGKELWRARLPAGGQATPMTYMGADGRQFVAIAAGGHGGLGTQSGDSLVAYALPQR
ncbi:membrane-bound PQQ-dependent dehydrogenase, glucose/quinate/shikimate family [Enterobacteriaceae bacterium H20N1]|uniref:Membrane-bound PQQ-dependent dehydrogenase, glucose/quinate/shikimate family n=1 Tax=Dryocola boscaweniae TaxID=2925397 RepID=A0A9X2W9S2_9ENTR|nr:membrane-bound PQQ-dependent dehydrogenase, glucose/quinate/shikimate family [Dryocola boscaweniae]MCT4703661.1 membrane-bound PQQ-dependent dehydrogenase, glucose/quinate/shikimate family [Dryocola boscaweniae]MCT4720829.1 membrane-bound PQQ-dependent dehydrogenase, glucose/quinate/shikimate family [Dryocola boscaweniae]